MFFRNAKEDKFENLDGDIFLLSFRNVLKHFLACSSIFVWSREIWIPGRGSKALFQEKSSRFLNSCLVIVRKDFNMNFDERGMNENLTFEEFAFQRLIFLISVPIYLSFKIKHSYHSMENPI